MAVNTSMACQFSRDGKYFALISTEGKLKIWNTFTNTFEQEFTPDFHLTSPPTCLHFVHSEGANKVTMCLLKCFKISCIDIVFLVLYIIRSKVKSDQINL
jgi:WD40 repeat protein